MPEERETIVASELIEMWRVSILEARASNVVKQELMEEFEAKVARRTWIWE